MKASDNNSNFIPIFLCWAFTLLFLNHSDTMLQTAYLFIFQGSIFLEHFFFEQSQFIVAACIQFEIAQYALQVSIQEPCPFQNTLYIIARSGISSSAIKISILLLQWTVSTYVLRHPLGLGAGCSPYPATSSAAYCRADSTALKSEVKRPGFPEGEPESLYRRGSPWISSYHIQNSFQAVN